MTDRDELEALLVAHQRISMPSCGCGWSKLGHSHPLHQADQILARWRLVPVERNDAPLNGPFRPGERVYHDVRDEWFTIIQDDPETGQALVEDDGRGVWLSWHHLWRTDAQPEPSPG